jgi:hypothetical protein
MLSLHERAGEVFLAALSRPVYERDAFLVGACTGDEALLQEVGSLLLFHEAGDAVDPRPQAEREDFSAGDVFGGFPVAVIWHFVLRSKRLPAFARLRRSLPTCRRRRTSNAGARAQALRPS